MEAAYYEKGVLFMIKFKVKVMLALREMTQKELAEKLNVTDKTVSRWECGVNLPDVAMLKSILAIYLIFY